MLAYVQSYGVVNTAATARCYNALGRMPQILRSKNLATKFRILLEMASRQPNVQQKAVAAKLGITSQAVSEYVKELMRDGWLGSQGRSRYKVTREGVDWILRMTRELHSYTSFVSKVVSDISTSTAIADSDLSEGQSVSLHMKGGLLFASALISDKGARGRTVSEARRGEDIGVSNVEGVIGLKMGEVTIGKVPNVQGGGSRDTDLARLKAEVEKADLVGVVGVEALVALKNAGARPDYRYGVREAAIEAASCGLSFLVLCAEDEVPGLAQRLEEQGLEYKMLNLAMGREKLRQ